MKQEKRVAHIVARETVIHNLFYRDEYSIWRSYKSPLTHTFNWLFIGEHDNVKSFHDAEDFTKYWHIGYPFNRRQTCVAAVNRKDKILVIAGKHDNLTWELTSALPNKYEWKIYHIYGEITNPWIAEKKYKYERIKGNLQYLISDYVERNLWIFRLAYTDKYYCGGAHINETFADDRLAKNIANFCKENNVSKTLMNTKLLYGLSFPYYNGYWSWTSSQTIVLDKKQIPTAQQIIDHTILSTGGLEELNIKMFYSKYCRGTLLSYSWKQVKDNWNTKLVRRNDSVADKARSWDDGEVIKWLSEYREAGHGEPLWQDVVTHFYKKYEAVIVERNKINAAKTEENRRTALRELAVGATEQERINSWRKHIQISHGDKILQYMSWCPATFKQGGYWHYNKIYPYEYNIYKFSNTQLRLLDDNRIETSRHCVVPLDDAVKLWKLFNVYADKADTSKDVNIDFASKNIMCGCYKLNWFKYTTKVTDTNVSLNRKEWCVCIGCHHIWISDFKDFVSYYHLEKQFYGTIK